MIRVLCALFLLGFLTVSDLLACHGGGGAATAGRTRRLFRRADRVQATPYQSYGYQTVGYQRTVVTGYGAVPTPAAVQPAPAPVQVPAPQ